MSEVTLEFAPEVEQALNISEGYVRSEESKSHALKFDDQGSVHLVDYDDNGKKIQDYVMGNKNKIEVPEGREQEFLDEIKAYKKSSRISNILFYTLVGILGLGMIIAILVLKNIGG